MESSQIRNNEPQRSGCHDQTKRIRLKKTLQKILQMNNNIIFLKKCKTNGITPKGLRIKNTLSMNDHTETLFDQFQRKILKQTIRNNYKYMYKAIHKLREHKTYFRISFPEVWEDLQNLIKNKTENLNESVKQRQMHKFDNLMKYQITDFKTKLKHKIKSNKFATIVNLSSKILSEDEECLLKLGMNFALPPRNIQQQTIETMIAIERVLTDSDISDASKDHIRYETTKIINSEKRKTIQTDFRMNNWIKSTIHGIRNDHNIIITKSDKGNSTVIMNRQDYDSKVTELIESGPYTKILNHFNPLSIIEEVG